jgi:hypothetical protein
MVTRNDLRKVMTDAVRFVRENKFTQKEALKTAWRNLKLCKKMSEGVVRFLFKKVDNTFRDARGTLASGVVPQTNGVRRNNDSCQTYFDVDKGEWRCYKKANLLFIL